ncbi:MAG: hypothetical protein MHM6MM_004693 [Cercozoa sp. M6MM]
MPAFKSVAEGLHNPKTHTTRPSVTGATVIGVKYKGGVALMADTLGSYGRMKRFIDIQRFYRVNRRCVLGVSGDVSDFQYIQRLLEDLVTEDACLNDGHEVSPRELHAYLTRVMHGRRSKVNPLWNQVLVAGIEDDNETPFLGFVDLYGTAFEEDTVATGFGLYCATPLLREHFRKDMPAEDAKALVEQAYRVVVYRHCNSMNKVQFVTVTPEEGVTISEPYALPTQWDYADFQQPLASKARFFLGQPLYGRQGAAAAPAQEQ